MLFLKWLIGFGVEVEANISNPKPVPVPAFVYRVKPEPEPVSSQLGYSPSKSSWVRVDTHNYGFCSHVYCR